MKKIIKKKLFLPIVSLLIGASLSPSVAFANETVGSYSNTVSLTQNYQTNEEKYEITPFAAVIEWVYKTENGKMYKRQFNNSTGQWIGEWQLCS